MSDTPIDARRDAVVAQLGAAWAAESIGEQEMERRMAAAFAAREPGDLERLVADLPAPSALLPMDWSATRGPVAPRGPQMAALRRVILGSVDDRVRGIVPPRVELGVRLGSVELDLTEAIFASEVTEIVVDVVLGNIELTLPEDVAIESDVHGVLSSVENKFGDWAVSSGQRLVRMTGRCLLGNVEVIVGGGLREG